jgi:hypothetical protein
LRPESTVVDDSATRCETTARASGSAGSDCASRRDDTTGTDLTMDRAVRCRVTDGAAVRRGTERGTRRLHARGRANLALLLDLNDRRTCLVAHGTGCGREYRSRSRGRKNEAGSCERGSEYDSSHVDRSFNATIHPELSKALFFRR